MCTFVIKGFLLWPFGYADVIVPKTRTLCRGFMALVTAKLRRPPIPIAKLVSVNRLAGERTLIFALSLDAGGNG